MPASNMDGIRHWKFVYDGVTVELQNTDYWVEPLGEVRDTGDLVPGLILNDIWEHVDENEALGLPRRKYLENRQAALRDMKGKQGALVLDEGEVEEELFTNITCLEFTPRPADTNDILEYNLEFGYPQVSTGAGGGGAILAQKIELGDEDAIDRVFIDSKNAVVDLSSEADKTFFKEMFRSAPIRVQGAIPLKLINITGIIDKNVPSFWSMEGDSDAGANYRANKLLDPNGTKFWRSAATALPHTIKGYRGDFSLFKVYRYGIVPTSDTTKAPNSWTLEGSVNDTSGWVTLDTQSGVTGWAAGEEKTFDLSGSWGNYKYLRLNISAVGSGNQVEVKEFKLYPFSATKTDTYHTLEHGQRAHVEDRIRMLRWAHMGQTRKIKINEDSLLGTTELTVHVRDVVPDDIEGLETPAYRMTLAYGYGE